MLAGAAWSRGARRSQGDARACRDLPPFNVCQSCPSRSSGLFPPTGSVRGVEVLV